MKIIMNMSKVVIGITMIMMVTGCGIMRHAVAKELPKNDTATHADSLKVTMTIEKGGQIAFLDQEGRPIPGIPLEEYLDTTQKHPKGILGMFSMTMLVSNPRYCFVISGRGGVVYCIQY